MNETFRLRLSSSEHRFVLLCLALLLTSTALLGADYPRNAMGRRSGSTDAHRHARTARVALFRDNDPQRAEKLALAEAWRSPHAVDGWFLAMESAALLTDRATELRGAVTVCKVAKTNDPRAAIAAMRLSTLGMHSETFARERSSIRALADEGGMCANSAVEALYEASLNGLPDTDARELARRAGWLTEWTLARTSATPAIPEKFEFPDAHIRLPEYLSRNASYTAEGSFVAPIANTYLIQGVLKHATISIDGDAVVTDTLALKAGRHAVKVIFRASDASPRIRVAPVEDLAIDWAHVHLPRLETEYLKAAVDLANNRPGDAADQIVKSPLAGTIIGQRVISEAAGTPEVETEKPQSCTNVHQAAADRFSSCGPDSLAFARWLISIHQHTAAVEELTRVLRQWPLGRDAYQLLISELQRAGDNRGADRAAAQFLSIAPNARNFRRMAESATDVANDSTAPFYGPYRRPAPAALTTARATDDAVILLQDKVAIARMDGSVSVYMHRVVQITSTEGAEGFRPLAVPEGSELLTARVINNGHALDGHYQPGDEIEEEYVVNFTGDGGMTSHPEAFQYVFSDFDYPLLDARFIVLSPASQTPAYVIASGAVPTPRTEFSNGLRAQIWEKTVDLGSVTINNPAIIRVVENENGWSIPPSVERRRILETIHPGPLPREA